LHAHGERLEMRMMLKKILLPATLATTLLGAAGCQQSPQTQSQTANAPAANTGNVSSSPTQPGAPETHLKVGDPAPDFTLTDTDGQQVKLSDFRGKKNVALAFYVLAFTGG
jgi:cytochrome oxidase Cu insertion factor (SCO1/SenC/PrrC family)